MSEAPVAPAEAAPVAAPEAAPVEAATPVESAAPVEPAAPSEPPKTYTQEDLDRITAKIRKNERYRTKKEIEAYYQGRESVAAPAPQQPQQSAADQPPQRDAYPDYESFLEAKAEFTGRKAAREERARAIAEEQQAKQRQTQQERIQTFQSKVQEKYPNLNERLEPIAHVVMPDGAAEALAESDFGPDILNHFADNTKDFERFASLSPSAALREIGKLEARFESAATKQTPTGGTPATAVKKPSSAPAPLKPVGGTAVLGDGEPSHDNPEAWALWRNRQLLKKKQG